MGIILYVIFLIFCIFAGFNGLPIMFIFPVITIVIIVVIALIALICTSIYGITLLVNWHKLAVEYNYSKSTAEAVAKIVIKMLKKRAMRQKMMTFKI